MKKYSRILAASMAAALILSGCNLPSKGSKIQGEVSESVENEVSSAAEEIASVDESVSEVSTEEKTPSKSVEEIDPFEKLEITYTGTSPYVSVSLDTSKCPDEVMKYVEFKTEEGFLRNGEEYEITAEFSDYDLEENNIKFTDSSKTYTVDGQPELLTSIEGVNMEELNQELADKLASVTAANKGDSSFAEVFLGYSKFEAIESQQVKARYIISLKKSFEDKYSTENYGYMCYNRYIEIHEYVVKLKDADPKKVYVLVYADNLTDNSGTLEWNSQLGSKAEADYDTLVNDFVTSQREYYNVSEIKDEDVNSESEAKKITENEKENTSKADSSDSDASASDSEKDDDKAKGSDSSSDSTSK